MTCLIVLGTMLTISFFVITDSQEEGHLLSAELAAALLVANLVPAMALLVLFGRRLARKRAAISASGSNGQLHIRLVALFSLLAAIPTLLVVIFASLLFQYGVQFFLSDKSRNMFENANALAEGYYQQSQEDLSNQTLALARDLRDYLNETAVDSDDFMAAYSLQVYIRSLSESAIIEIGEDGQIRTPAIAKLEGQTAINNLTPEIMRKVNKKDEVFVAVNADRVEAITAIDAQSRIYLYTARVSDFLAFSQGQNAQNVLNDYNRLSQEINKLQFRFNLALLIISLLVVGIAVWAALRLADRMVRPLDELAVAARELSTGNFAPRVATTLRRDEIGVLGRAFNRMARRLERQTDALVSANSQLDERRAFIEAVLESVTAGIISIDGQGDIRLINSSAQKLLFTHDDTNLVGRNLHDLGPSFAKLVASGDTDRIIQYASANKLLTLAVKIAREPIGYVITFEDITQQLVDQRQAAWSDVAQRIAHEIKNPLTPIQLATERLKKRYAKEVVSDPEIFEQLTDTIIRQVGDLRNMVDEFSSFAKMPKPIFREENFYELVRQAVFIHEVAHGNIVFALVSPTHNIPLNCDRRQIGQALTNIIKNAIESIEVRAKREDDAFTGEITVDIDDGHDRVMVSVRDNGLGLPDDKDRIIEPYMTTREKGTGLGLAIVKKIVEEHHGDIVFENGASRGAIVTLSFNVDLLRQAVHESVAA